MSNDWVKDLFAAIDAKSTPNFVSFLTSDASFIFGNNPASVGTEAITGTLNWFFDSIKAISHKNLQVFDAGDNNLFVRGTVTYTRHSDTQLTVEYCNHFVMESGKIKIYHIFIDNSLLYAEGA